MKMKTTATYGTIKLPILNQSGPAVPTSCLNIKLPAADKKALAIAYKNNIPALLIGETGTGKTSAIKELAYLLKQRYTRISLTGYTTPDELIGSKSVKDGATYYEDGILTKAMKEGHIVVLDELNAITPDTSFIIHSLIDDERKIALPNGDIITPAPEFRVFATINPDYEGTKSLNRAFLDRFGVLITVNTAKPEIERKILQDRAGIDEDTAARLVALAWLNRKAYAERKTLTYISTRSLLQVAELIKEGLEAKIAYTTAIVNKAVIDDRRAFLDFFNIIYKTDGAGDYVNDLPQVLTPEEVANMNAEIQAERELKDKYYNSYTEERERADKAEVLLSEKTAIINRLLGEPKKN